jgi:hypothetical protein
MRRVFLLPRAPPFALEQHDAGGHRYVQRRNVAFHGNAHQHVAMLAHLLVQALALAAETRAVGRCIRRGRNRRRRARRGRRSSGPGSFNSSSVRLMLVTRVTGRYSSAPAAALATTSVRPTARRSGMMMPPAPAACAVRTIAPRLCGSSTPSSTTINCGGGDVVQFGVALGRSHGDHALVRRRAGQTVERRRAPRSARTPTRAAPGR